MMTSWIVYAIGFTAQFFFGARTLIQWLSSEKSGKVESPSWFWIFSAAGAWLMFFYGVLRDDFAIILGQLIAYFIYLWNLSAKGIWAKLHPVVRAVLSATPFLALGYLLLLRGQSFSEVFFRNEGIPLWLVVFGSSGQVIFTLRFVYQWFYSRKRGESILPSGFWIISLAGSGIIIAYGIVRKDPVLILGQIFGFVAYIRNLMIGVKNKRKNEKETA